jgi:hypothetical protein
MPENSKSAMALLEEALKAGLLAAHILLWIGGEP